MNGNRSTEKPSSNRLNHVTHSPESTTPPDSPPSQKFAAMIVGTKSLGQESTTPPGSPPSPKLATVAVNAKALSPKHNGIPRPRSPLAVRDQRSSEELTGPQEPHNEPSTSVLTIQDKKDASQSSVSFARKRSHSIFSDNSGDELVSPSDLRKRTRLTDGSSSENTDHERFFTPGSFGVRIYHPNHPNIT